MEKETRILLFIKEPARRKLNPRRKLQLGPMETRLPAQPVSA
jgi:hypothetical protein